MNNGTVDVFNPSGGSMNALVPASIGSLEPTRAAGHIDAGFVGDVYLSDDFLASFGTDELGGLRSYLWRPLSGASIIIANLEAPITGQDSPREQKLHNHKMSNAALEIFDQRFVLSLANNHIMDFGVAGLADTLSVLDAAGIHYAGAGPNLAQAMAPCLRTVDGVKIGVICAADPRFQPATKDTPGTFPARRDLLVQAVRATISDGTVVVVSLHMGLEHVSVPSAAQVALAKACLDSGAAVVHFHHSHRLGGAATGNRGAVLFGTGNYVYTKPARLASARRTASWRTRIDKETHTVIAVGADPATIDERGLPIPLDGAAAASARAQIESLGQVPLEGRRRQWAQLKQMLQPGFLKENFRNYASIMRMQGFRHLLKVLSASIRAQIGGAAR